MFRQKQIHQAVLALCAGGFVASVAAQQQPPADQAPPAASEQQLRRVEVTGSRIKRIDTETPSPVSVITREQIERSGALSVSEVLKRAPAANAGSFDENAVASFTPGAASASLRGLGAQATLVLINGRRVAPFGFASGGQTTFVDINQIPIDVVERIEVLLDGASAIYGSDAIGGVINVILRHDYNGFQVSGSLGQSTHGDGLEKNGSITYGHGSLASDGYNFFVNYQHIDQKPVLASAREATSTADYRRFGLPDYRSSYAYQGNLYTAAGAFIGPLSPCKPLNDPTAATNGRCIYNHTHHTDDIAKSQRDSVTAAGTLDLSRGFQLFADGTIGRTEFTQESPSYSTSTYQQTGTLATPYIILPANHPQNTTGAPIRLRYRFADYPFLTDPVSETERGVLGIRNGDFYGWDVESGLLYSHSHTTIKTTGIINDTVLLNEVLQPDGTANPAFTFGNPSANDPGLMSRLYPKLRDVGTTTTSSIDLRGSRDIYTLPAGPVTLALGAELRHEKFSSQPDPLKAAGDISVFGSSESEGGRTIGAGYAEFAIPVFKNFEASLAARVDHYSDFGTTTNPKLGFKWKVLPSLAFRGTYATGFRAPAITELSTSPSSGFFDNIRDPKNCPVFDQTNANCAVSLPATFTSNRGLKPEKSKNFSAGLIFEPLDNVSIAFDVYKLKQRNTITFLDPDYLLAHESQYPGLVNRNPDGTLNSLNLSYANLGEVQIWGYDIDLKASQNLGEIGKLGVILSYDHEPSYKVANVPGAPLVQFAGTHDQPKDRARVGFSFDRGPWSSSLTFSYTGKYALEGTPDGVCPFIGAPNEYLCTVQSFLTTDLFIGYKGFKNLELGLTIKNLDNRQAPLDQNLATRFTFYDPTFHDAMGRFVQISGKYTFW